MRKLYVVRTNTDLTEGRGYPLYIYHCSTEVTARRLARGRGVMGSNADVVEVDLLEYEGKEYIPFWAVSVEYATEQDIATQIHIDTKREAIQKAKAAGLTDAEIAVLTNTKWKE